MAEENLQFENRKFYWSIRNFDMWPLSYENAIYSPKFSIDSAAFTRFCLMLFTRVIDKEQYVSLYLLRHATDRGPKYVCLEFQIALTDCNWNSTSDSMTYTNTFEKGTSCGCRTFIKKSSLKTLAKEMGGRLFIKCEYALDDDEGENYSPWICNYSDLESLSRDFYQSLCEGRHCNVNLRSSDGIVHKVHKPVLITRFPNLSEQLNSENNTTINEIGLSIDSSTLHVLLKYLYSGKLDMENSSPEIYDALHGFKIPHLQQLLFPAFLSEIAAITTIEVKRVRFVWKLPIFSSFSRNTTLIKTFCFDELLEWTKMKLSYSIGNKMDAPVFSVQTMCSEVNIHMKCKIHLGFQNRAKEYEHDFQKQTTWFIPYAFDVEEARNEMNHRLKKGVLDVFFEFKISVGRLVSDVYPASRTTEYQASSNLWILQEDFKKLYKDPKHGDVTLCVEGEVLKAHKVVLSARSPVFSKMFEHKMLEEQTDSVVIQDVKKDVAEVMLSYIYYGELEREPKDNDFAIAIDLYEAADKYEVLQLKEKCILYFIREMNGDNVGKLLNLAYMHSDAPLKKLVKDFVLFNVDEVINSHMWNEIMRDRTHLAEDMNNITVAAQELGSSIVMTMLFCLYCGGLDKEQNSVDSVIKLYEDSQKYKMLYLKNECILYFGEAINSANFGKLLILADENDDEILEKHLHQFVTSCLDELLNSEELDEILREKPHLVADMQTIVHFRKEISSRTAIGFCTLVYLGNLGRKERDMDSLINVYLDTIKYNLSQMKLECISYFDRVLNVKNIYKLLNLTDHCTDESLQNCLEKFVSSNVDKILESDEWDRLMRQRLDVSEDMKNIAARELAPEILLTMLSYIHCGKLNKKQYDFVFNLYKGAQSFKLFQLVDQCLSIFNSIISTKNVGELFKLSEAYNDKTLKKHIQTFVASNVCEILDSKEWRQIPEERPALAEDLQHIALAAEVLGPEILMTMLSYIYCGKLDKESGDLDSVVKLHKDAHNYKLPQLKKECICFLKSSLNVGHIGKVLKLADNNNDADLKTYVYDFICCNAREVLNSDEWRYIVTDNPRIAHEMLNATLAAIGNK